MIDEGILDGDLIAVRKTHSADIGQIIVARIDDEVTVKRLERDGNNAVLQPANDCYEPIILPAEDAAAAQDAGAADTSGHTNRASR